MTLNRITSISFLLFAIHLLVSQPAVSQDWQLVWSDEFGTETLDTTNWEYMIGTGSQYGVPAGWGNSELQYYTDREENIFVQDGKLHIVAREESYRTRNYTSARIRSLGKADFRYGKFEVRARMPKGQGLWPAIWMLPTDNVYGGWPRSGEIDILEIVGHEPHIAHGTIHYGESAGAGHSLTGGRYILRDGSTFNDDFHIFSIIWEPERIEWYVNGNLYHFATPGHTNPYPWVFDQKFHLLLNVAVGGNWPGNPDNTTEFPQEMVVDWIRVYQDATLTSAGDETEERPGSFTLSQNYPNPFNPTTNISFEIAEAGHVSIKVYDMLGRLVARPVNGDFHTGSHTISFDASNLSSGTYIYRLESGGYEQARTMQLMK
ncbi:family 16 glycosylhydrolase [Balneolales bacterium ANBcel1]|nr:family 16 glycosylhydrolase [Balneolales bacterium ANBcel1]